MNYVTHMVVVPYRFDSSGSNNSSASVYASKLSLSDVISLLNDGG